MCDALRANAVLVIKTGSSVILLSLLYGLSIAEGAAVRVRLPEGNARGFLVLRSLDGQDIAYGELRQKPTGGLIETRLVLHFKDGSLRAATAVFSQRSVFRLERYHLVQRGLHSRQRRSRSIGRPRNTRP